MSIVSGEYWIETCWKKAAAIDPSKLIKIFTKISKQIKVKEAPRQIMNQSSKTAKKGEGVALKAVKIRMQNASNEQKQLALATEDFTEALWICRTWNNIAEVRNTQTHNQKNTSDLHSVIICPSRIAIK